MFSKLIFVLATVCVVNASVLIVNVFDDDLKSEVASNPKDCDFRACDQLCRRLKFPGGACVNGRCKCDNFLNADDAVSDKSLSNLESSVSQQDHPETEVAAKPSKCNLTACKLVCRWVKKSSGSCVDGRCTCAKSLIAEDDMINPAKFLSPGSCNFRACDQQCFRFGYPGGTCVNGRCKCGNTLHTEVSESNEDDSVSSRACNNRKCNQMCRKQKFRGGACVGANCYCNKFYSLLEDTMTDSAESLPLSSCNSIACDDQCRRTGWHSGVCINGQCKCDYFLNTEDTMTDPAKSLPLSSCNSIACDDQCRRTGWNSGVCINGQCKCDYFLYTDDTMTDPAESLPLSSCNSIACDDQCRRTGWHSGVCVKGQCKCDYFLNTKVSENSLSNSEDSVSPRKCTHEECKALCRRLKFREGVCIAGRCSCNNYFPTPEDTANELAESISLDDSFLGTEEELVVPSPRACNTVTCNQMCHRLNYAGGWCRFGQCQCY